jgi:hypothetical protein
MLGSHGGQFHQNDASPTSNGKISQRYAAPRLVGQGCAQSRHFIFNLGWIGDGLGDLQAQECCVTAAQPMGGHAGRAFAQVEDRAYFRVGARVVVPGQTGLQDFI